MPAWYAGDVSGSPGEELVEWVDDSDRVIEIVTRARMRSENLRHRSVAIIVTSTDGRLLVHRRADTKDLLPGWWDVCAGGVVAVGEPDDVAARRELGEELGIAGVEPERVGAGHHEDDHTREICHVFHVVHDGPYLFADGEVAEARLVTPPELTALLEREPFLPSGLRLVLPLVPGFT
jgi:isopentenyldiphosphate isomerase